MSHSTAEAAEGASSRDGVVVTPLLWTCCTSELWLWEDYRGYLRHPDCIKALQIPKTLSVSSLALGAAFLSKAVWPELTYLVLLCSAIC